MYLRCRMNTEDTKQVLVQELEKMIDRPGGKQAFRYFLNVLSGIIPYAGGFISASNGLSSEYEQHSFNRKFVEWIHNNYQDITKILHVLESQLREPTKANLSILLGEVLNAELPDEYPLEGVLQVNTILHGETLSEFKVYEKLGWLTIHPTYSACNMGANNRSGNAIEDKKRPYGFGNGYVITFNKELYD